MGQRDGQNQREDGRGGSRGTQGHAGAFRGEPQGRRDSARGEFGGLGRPDAGPGYGGKQGYGGGRWGSGGAYETGAAGARNRGPKGWQRSDDRIHDDVCQRLADESALDPSDVSVEVKDGKVTLSGSVPDRVMKYRIEDLVESRSGVRDVDNRLRVSRGGAGGLLGGGPMGMGGGGADDGRGAPRSRGDSRGGLLGRLFGLSGGTRLADLMTRNPRTVAPDETLQKVAQLMKDENVGSIPVCTDRHFAGMVTDRDIVIRAVAAGRPLEQTKVSEVMTREVHSCAEDDDIEAVLDRMGSLQVRRIPVVDRQNQLVGIVSLGDFAQRDTGNVDDALQGISQPG